MRRHCLIACALSLLTLAGCGRRPAITPIDARALVLAVGADKAGKQDVRYTLEIPSPQSLSGSSGGGNEFYSVQAVAKSLAEAISHMENETSRDIYLGQMHVLILALDLPPDLRDRLIAEEERFGETDDTQWFALADGKAGKLLQPPALEERLPAFFYSTHFNCVGCQSIDYGVPAWRVQAELAAPGSVAVVPVAKAQDGQIMVNRVAALRRLKAPFVFTPEETVSVMTLRGRLTKGSFTFPTPLGSATVRSMHAKVTRSAAIGRDRRLHLTAKVTYQGLVAQRPARVQHMTAKALGVMQESCAKALAQKLTAAISRAQRAGVDPFDFAQTVYLEDPEAFRALGDYAAAFRQAVVTVRVQVHLPDQGILV